ncbi:RtcB family protein [Streptomonospora wellingtoniae]|uniref:3'-phosphate/5'-hydroxy nucleic acid ligase n=1 Tax=Streptomonospora wellingtoniae TaxID=3075544 RepID=A0ABU2KU26_9ACTN|nr:RtcB family protein [Streptomonospora sp. DSM 45055]MDT0302794.1 RtcB family protein [Streptomonospora sp. DSM 45055]
MNAKGPAPWELVPGLRWVARGASPSPPLWVGGSVSTVPTDPRSRFSDEIPAAYKDISAVIDAQTDLVEVAARLRQVVCVKG